MKKNFLSVEAINAMFAVERKIKESYEENGGFYDCMGDLYQF